ncbi:8-oxo-dGTP diphosphatase [Alteromonadaceae bacterium 2753L.S.0a.02]|nr:8-oxo-dGTP diphosphatase [Alteromonadaceae bacterium 2753L.S.0a.02]
MPNTALNQIHVAVGVIVDPAGQVLLSCRQAGQHLAGFWEFPGGKVEPGESVEQALSRELEEELGIVVQNSEPLIQIPYTYPEKTVLLDVHVVSHYTGKVRSREGQPLNWVAVSQLGSVKFPPANKPIVSALQLPDRICITGSYAGFADLRANCLKAIEIHKCSLIQYRAPWLTQEEYLASYLALRNSLPTSEVSVFANTHWSTELLQASELTAVHLSSKLLGEVEAKTPFTQVSAACHNLEQLRKAEAMGVDFVYFSAVQATSSHPDEQPQGWQALQEFCARAAVPVYALGGLDTADIARAKACGAQGIAAISAFWGT